MLRGRVSEDASPRAPRAMRSRRLVRCEACWLPVLSCLCAELPRIAASTRLVVVMHRREAVTSSNTGRLAGLCVEGAEVRVRGRSPSDEPLPPGRTLVLFPFEGARPLAMGDAGQVLLVPDGTWTQARRIARRDPLLRSAEPVTLPSTCSSRYGLRRGVRAGGLSTLEAIGRALALLEGDDSIATRLDALLDAFVERQLRARRDGGRLSLPRSPEP